jgi:hypothetical protein
VVGDRHTLRNSEADSLVVLTFFYQ